MKMRKKDRFGLDEIHYRILSILYNNLGGLTLKQLERRFDDPEGLRDVLKDMDEKKFVMNFRGSWVILDTGELMMRHGKRVV